MTTVLYRLGVFILQILVAVGFSVAILKLTGTILTEKQLILFAALIGISGPVFNFFSKSPVDKQEVVKLTLVNAVTAVVLTSLFVLALKFNWLNF